MPDYLKISSPGQIPKMEVGFDIPEGDSIDPTEVQVDSTIPTFLYATEIVVSAEAREVSGVTFPAGAVVEFTLVCAANAPETDVRNPHYVYIDYRTFGDTIPERLRWKKRCDVTAYLPLD